MFRTPRFQVVTALFIGLVSPWLCVTSAQQPPAARLQELEKRINATVREAGAVESASATEIRSEVESIILEIIPEGSKVKQGDVIIKLDASALEEQLHEQRLVRAQKHAELAAVEQTLERIAEEGTARKEFNALLLMAAEKQREQTLGDFGELALQLKQASAALNIARSKLSVAKELLKTAGVTEIDKQQIAAAQAAAAEAQEEIGIAEARQKYLQGPLRELQEIRSKLAIAEVKLTTMSAEAEYRQQEEAVKAKLSASKVQNDKAASQIERTERQIESCSIRAPIFGVAQYVSSGHTRVNLAPGTEVRARQSLVRIANMEQVVIRARVNETRISRVRVGQPAIVEVDAFPGVKLPGKVKHVNTTPEPSSFYSAGIKTYSVIISLDEKPESLKLGMTALVEIRTDAD